jgi:hypothetical protein
VEWLCLPRFVAVKEENKFFTLQYELTSIASRDLTKSENFTSGSLCISKGYVSMWILGNQRPSLYHMAHVAQGAWTLNKIFDHDMGVCSPDWPFFFPSNPQLTKFCVLLSVPSNLCSKGGDQGAGWKALTAVPAPL